VVVRFVAALSSDELKSAAQNMDELEMVKGDTVIQQDDIGDCFFVLEEGQVEISVSVTCLWLWLWLCFSLTIPPMLLLSMIIVIILSNLNLVVCAMQRKTNVRDPDEVPKILARLGKNGKRLLCQG